MRKGDGEVKRGALLSSLGRRDKKNFSMTLQQEIAALHERNRRVELDKAWETSFFRRSLVMIFIYATAALFMFIAHLEKSWLGALVPALGYLLSTLSFPPIKRLWMRKK